MKSSKDPAIKLFGKEIPLPENERIPAISGENKTCSDWVAAVAGKDGSSADECPNSMVTSSWENNKVSRIDRATEDEELEAEKDPLPGNPSDSKEEKKTTPGIEESTHTECVPDSEENPKTPSIDEEEAVTAKPSKAENDQSDTENSQQKPLKKPDKILPCPRCNSMDTKFCYYNNYNVNQPRHFCKSCQRYWTSGGTMRNVPVGAGRRKNKNATSHCRHVTISEALHAVQLGIQNGAGFNPNGTVLSFGPEATLCEPMGSVLSLAERKVPNGIPNGLFYRIEQGIPVASSNGGENGDDCSSGSSVTTSNSMEDRARNGVCQEPIQRNFNDFHPQIPCLPGVPWPSYPWNPQVPLPAFCPNSIPMPIIPAPFWNCSIPGAWAVPWLPPPSFTMTQNPTISASNSPILGKHSREGELIKPKSNSEGKEQRDQKDTEGSIVIPKTLRIDDPDEAARSSIWETLGIKNDSISRGSLFKGFQSQDGEKKHIVKTSPALRANPAAFSRSLRHQEGA